MKKIMSLFVFVLVLLTLVACASKTDVDNPMLDNVTEKDIADLEDLVNNIDGLYIGLLDNSSITNSTNIEMKSNVITIKSGGTYTVTGTLNDGQIVIDTNDSVIINLSNVSIHNADGAAIYIEDADGFVTINLMEGTQNTLSDGTSHTDEEITGVLYSKDTLIIAGTGTLLIEANYLDGIVSKNSLVIENGIFNISSVGDAIYGKDDITINDGTFTIFTGEGSAEAPVIEEIMGGGPGGRPGNPIPSTTTDEENEGSFKALKTQGKLTINGGTFTIDSYDDSIHSDEDIIINNGTFSIESGDDAIHANSTLEINGGNINILYSCEGLEAFSIILNNGYINVYAYDDGLNATSGVNTSVGGPGDHPDYSDYDIDSTPSIIINGGTLIVESDGDGIDANGVVIINDGQVYICGKGTSLGMIESPIDFDITGIVNGGTVIATGTSTMAYEFDNIDSTQNSFKITFNKFYSEGTEIVILDTASTTLIKMTVTNSFETIIFSSDDLVIGADYKLVIGDDFYNITLNSITTVITS